MAQGVTGVRQVQSIPEKAMNFFVFANSKFLELALTPDLQDVFPVQGSFFVVTKLFKCFLWTTKDYCT
jgi:hypothetical protein